MIKQQLWKSLSGYFWWLGILPSLGCAAQPFWARPYYHEYTTAQKERVIEICDHVAASHFVVEQRRVYFRNAHTSDDVTMPHYNTELPDGYYFCSDPLLERSHLE